MFETGVLVHLSVVEDVVIHKADGAHLWGFLAEAPDATMLEYNMQWAAALVPGMGYIIPVPDGVSMPLIVVIEAKLLFVRVLRPPTILQYAEMMNGRKFPTVTDQSDLYGPEMDLLEDGHTACYHNNRMSNYSDRMETFLQHGQRVSLGRHPPRGRRSKFQKNLMDYEPNLITKDDMLNPFNSYLAASYFFVESISDPGESFGKVRGVRLVCAACGMKNMVSACSDVYQGAEGKGWLHNPCYGHSCGDGEPKSVWEVPDFLKPEKREWGTQVFRSPVGEKGLTDGDLEVLIEDTLKEAERQPVLNTLKRLYGLGREERTFFYQEMAEFHVNFGPGQGPEVEQGLPATKHDVEVGSVLWNAMNGRKWTSPILEDIVYRYQNEVDRRIRSAQDQAKTETYLARYPEVDQDEAHQKVNSDESPMTEEETDRVSHLLEIYPVTKRKPKWNGKARAFYRVSGLMQGMSVDDEADDRVVTPKDLDMEMLIYNQFHFDRRRSQARGLSSIPENP